MGVLDELLAAEHAGWRALCAGRGRAFYADEMVDDGRMVVPGMVLTKSGAIEGIDDTDPWIRYAIGDATALHLGDDVAALTYRVEAARATGEPYRALVTSTFRRVDGRWRLAMHQQTPDPS